MALKIIAIPEDPGEPEYKEFAIVKDNKLMIAWHKWEKEFYHRVQAKEIIPLPSIHGLLVELGPRKGLKQGTIYHGKTKFELSSSHKELLRMIYKLFQANNLRIKVKKGVK